ncbi:UdgX family uracil-DNA binding protein [Nitrosovibrio tenuis]|uniref:Type-4 uracil-DNA glycosylase n=1 Tax=Nitrosovibrio tenuis TaxID=1233 RepID=A0A1H7JAY9_9PROT|nr:UdgX family uracil-DNA binding protein [Nitrosovibrio tenuis]SEK71758.1 DNA polymerase [Nitrosovibrio tenuis]
MKARPGYAPNPADQAGDSIEALREAASTCRACPLWEKATQTVFGEGPAHAPIMFIGEQPGDQEDLAGRPFVGPAGLILARALAAAGIPREQVYVTNAVKHFKFEVRGKRRLHKKPVDAEIAACHDWLRREIELVTPRLLVAMGATAVRSVLGRSTPIKLNRGKLLEYACGISLLITVHPSFLLRMPEEDKDEEYRRFISDLKLAEPFLR